MDRQLKLVLEMLRNKAYPVEQRLRNTHAYLGGLFAEDKKPTTVVQAGAAAAGASGVVTGEEEGFFSDGSSG